MSLQSQGKQRVSKWVDTASDKYCKDKHEWMKTGIHNDFSGSFMVSQQCEHLCLLVCPASGDRHLTQASMPWKQRVCCPCPSSGAEVEWISSDRKPVSLFQFSKNTTSYFANKNTKKKKSRIWGKHPMGIQKELLLITVWRQDRIVTWDPRGPRPF